MDTENKVFYKILEISIPFPGLTQDAIEFLKEAGEWLKLIDVRNYNYKGDLGLLFISNDESSVDNFNLVGILVEDKVLPTLVYDTIELSDGNLLPLFKYKLIDGSYVYEVQDKLQSTIYNDIKTLALRSEDIILFEWTQEEIEVAELLLEHDLGY